MKDIIDILNHTSRNRTIFYCVVIIIICAIIAEILIQTIKLIKKKVN